MTEISPIEGLDRDLRFLADRVARAGYDPRRTLRRLWWVERWPLIALVATAAAVVGALVGGYWLPALAIAVFLLPNRVYDWRARTAEREALLVDGDFFERERENLERRVSWGRTFALLGLGMAAVVACLAIAGPHRGPGIWLLVAIIAARPLVWLAVIGPALTRELKDLGGDVSGGWIMVFILIFITLAAPFLVLYGVIRRGVRRMLGRPVEEDE